MATRQKKGNDSGVVGRLADRGEEAMTRVMEELGRNARVTDALSKAMTAKEKLDDASRGALASIGLAASDELKDLRRQIEKLEKRLASLEGSSKGGGAPSKADGAKGVGTAKPTAKKSETKKTPTTAKSTRSAGTKTKKKAEETASPSPGRSIGGGPARGTTPSRGRS